MENQCSKQESYHVAEAKQEAQLMNSLLNICRVHIFFFHSHMGILQDMAHDWPES